VGPFECPRALAPGQPAGFRRWHPCCRRCLLKDCERWFLPPWPQARYCSPACREAANRWRSWHAGQTYRASAQGKERRREQARRHRERQQQRSALAEPAPTVPIEPALPVVETQATSDSIPIIPTGPQSVGQRPAEILPKSCALPCSRPGCYVLFLSSPRSPDQHFCSGSCRQALRRVRQREARLRRRRQRGTLGRYLRHRGPPPGQLGHVAVY
jgi:predicted nucleic acid-binding Zn ribbon protein